MRGRVRAREEVDGKAESRQKRCSTKTPDSGVARMQAPEAFFASGLQLFLVAQETKRR